MTDDARPQLKRRLDGYGGACFYDEAIMDIFVI